MPALHDNPPAPQDTRQPRAAAPNPPAPATAAPATTTPSPPAPGTAASSPPATAAPNPSAPGTAAPSPPAPGTAAPCPPAPGIAASGLPAPGTAATNPPAPTAAAPSLLASGTAAPSPPAPGIATSSLPAPGTAAPNPPAPGTATPDTAAPCSAAPERPHDWLIEEVEYVRHEARRGRRFAFERVVPARTALVVIDMVPFFVAANPRCRGIVPNINRLATALRTAGGTVAWVLPAAGPPNPWAQEFYGPATAEVFRTAGGSGPLPGRLWPALAHHRDDLLVEKHAPSAFFPGRCTLPALLDRRGVDTVLITGTVTNVCCESSARDAATLGLRVVMVADANAAKRDRDHNATLHTVYRSFGDVRPTADVLALLDRSG